MFKRKLKLSGLLLAAFSASFCANAEEAGHLVLKSSYAIAEKEGRILVRQNNATANFVPDIKLTPAALSAIASIGLRIHSPSKEKSGGDKGSAPSLPSIKSNSWGALNHGYQVMLRQADAASNLGGVSIGVAIKSFDKALEKHRRSVYK